MEENTDNTPLVTSPDTDDLIYCLDIEANGRLKDNIKLRFITGKLKDRRVIDVRGESERNWKCKVKSIDRFPQFHWYSSVSQN